MVIVKISIHTPTQGVTIWYKFFDFLYGISIHTPTQGVTQSLSTIRGDISNFNPHSHAGSDDLSGNFNAIWHDFNPHSHAGSDEKILRRIMESGDFNPHSHAGSDIEQLYTGANYDISIHTPTQGVTYLNPPLILKEEFQSTLPRRE